VNVRNGAHAAAAGYFTARGGEQGAEAFNRLWRDQGEQVRVGHAHRAQALQHAMLVMTTKLAQFGTGVSTALFVP